MIRRVRRPLSVASGFSVAEVLIYLSSASILIVSCLALLTNVSHNVHRLEKVYRWYQALTVLDLIRGDLARASYDPATWDEKKLLFTCYKLDDHDNLQSYTVHWYQAKDGWKRRSGKYLTTTKRWQRSVVRHFPTTLKHISCTLVYDTQASSRVSGVTLSYELNLPNDTAYRRCGEYLPLRNKMIVAGEGCTV